MRGWGRDIGRTENGKRDVLRSLVRSLRRKLPSSFPIRIRPDIAPRDTCRGTFLALSSFRFPSSKKVDRASKRGLSQGSFGIGIPLERVAERRLREDRRKRKARTLKIGGIVDRTRETFLSKIGPNGERVPSHVRFKMKY